MSLKIALGADHAGFGYKEKILAFLRREGHIVKDFGTHSADSIDYADFAHPVATSVESHESDFGILICGSGNGVAMTANKHQQIRAALCWKEELAALARQHNNANVLCMPERFVDYEEAEKMVKAFLSVKFEGGRHERRVGKISC
ncbi:ribose 5-phosphate isomerase B [Imperialibacter roseus]|uniref:Ribose 5-phosphate isomerase B n=1 Tax=Imperialibacter roseus TaxID=1324217 RepID=A0ABZ0IM28_9BACT|nr:ribose 5-phosphate isomerase B [Imperialibacter roseus]WOK06077.1 ribose 5-phosphate isomerase B [Imperialibacter roseus]|tara:strand:- start:6085 stop:6519 length:435 start_codon:yes stop_codon:yes gene_type:complete